MAVPTWEVHQSLQALLFWLHCNLMITGANTCRALTLCQAFYAYYLNNPYNKPREGTFIILIFKQRS